MMSSLEMASSSLSERRELPFQTTAAGDWIRGPVPTATLDDPLADHGHCNWKGKETGAGLERQRVRLGLTTWARNQDDEQLNSCTRN